MALVLSSVVPTLVLAFVLLMVDLSTATKLVVVGTIAGALVGGWIIWGLGRVVASMGTLMGRDSALTGFEHRQDEVGTLMASYNKLLATVEQQATGVLAELSHGINVLARYDGSRFAALLVETPRQEALRFVDRARDAVTTGFSHAAEITLRIGIASLPDDAMLADELLSVADTSLRRGTEA